MRTSTGNLPPVVEDLLDRALVAELTVVDPSGRLVTYPLIPLYDGACVSFTSSVLFSRKLEHIKADPRVALSITDPDATPGAAPFRRVTIQGDARVVEDDPHEGWMGDVYEAWKAKEPVIQKFVRMRFAFPLFFERSVIEVTPRRVLLWPEDGGEPDLIDVDAPISDAPGDQEVSARG